MTAITFAILAFGNGMFLVARYKKDDPFDGPRILGVFWGFGLEIAAIYFALKGA